MPVRMRWHKQKQPEQLSIHLFLADNFDEDDLIAILVHFIEKRIPQHAKQPWLLHIKA